jgi:uncharacterized radical SAM protein YgiQ
LFLPTTLEEFKQLGWDQADILLVTGDSYIDSPFIGVAVIGKALIQAGFRVGIIAQPDEHSADDITRLGEPRLFWGVTGGSIDSMVANYTASRKKRHNDDYTPGGINNRRPDRAVIVYSNLIRRHFKKTVPIVLGGIEASLRRVTHYDYWSDHLRRPILFDAKATHLLYGMAEGSVVDLAHCLQLKGDPTSLPGLCYIAAEAPEGYLEMPSHEDAVKDKHAFIELFHMFYQNNDPLNAKGLWQKVGDRVLVQNPPAPYTDQTGLDAIYAQDYERDQHPYYARQGAVRALETIRFAISTHRGCYGECNFCAIAVHEGRTVRWRSEESILAEARRLTVHPEFKGYIQDVGGPTANMYGFECSKKLKMGSCADRRCLYPEICPALKIDHSRQLSLLRKIRQIPGVKKAFVASGIRYDMVLHDKKHGNEYLREIVDFHVSGQLKVAPEHTVGSVLKRMGKPAPHTLLEFKQVYDELNRETGRDQFLTYYLIAAYPGCSDEDMKQLRDFAAEKLHIHPEQVQIFTPTPSTYASLMYYTEMDPFTLEPLFVEKDPIRKDRQKQIVIEKGEQKGRWR